MKALVTGFEPFGGERVNPSFEALRRLPPRLGSLDIATRPLPVVYGAALPALFETAVGSPASRSAAAAALIGSVAK